MSEPMTFTINIKTILKLAGLALLIYGVYLVRDILLLLFVSVILAALIEPFAGWFQTRRIPRSVAVIIIYILLFGLIGLAIALLTPIIVEDVPQLVQNVEHLLQSLQANPTWQKVMEMLGISNNTFASDPLLSSGGTQRTAPVDGALSGVFSTITGFFGGIFSLVLILVMTFYLVVQDDAFKRVFHSIIPDEYVPFGLQLFKKIRDKLGYWLRAQLLLSIVVGLLVFVGLFVLQVKYAAVLALFAALLEFIPYVGPVLAAIPALILAFSQGGPIDFTMVLVLYIVIQQIENHFLIPKVMQRAVGLNPIVSILAILIGARIAGIIGALIAIPVATALGVFFTEIGEKRRQEAEPAEN